MSTCVVCQDGGATAEPPDPGYELVQIIERQSAASLSLYACTPCIEESPRLRAMRDELRDPPEGKPAGSAR